MSLQWSLSRQVPEDTAAIGRLVLKEQNVYRQIGDHFDELFPAECEFAALYDTHGRGAISPLLLALVTVFQMLDKVPDRQAAEFVATRIDWKYALHLPLTYAGFDWSDLLAFRTRLLEHQQERLVYDRFLVQLQKLGLVQRRGKMRTDSTHVLGVVERLSQLELVTESIRVALAAVTAQAAAWVQQLLPASFQARYHTAQSEYGLSAAEVRTRLVQAGQDGFWFLGQLERTGPAALGALPAVVVLRQVLAQQFPDGPAGPPHTRRPTGVAVIESPHEPEVRYGVKRGQGWQGYKVQVTETCDAEQPHLISDIAATSALANDGPQLPAIQERLAARDLTPAEQHVDQGYMSGEHLVRSAAQGISLEGLPLADTQGPAGFRQTDFSIDMAAQCAYCPAGQRSQMWRQKAHPSGALAPIQIRFAGGACRACRFFGQCTRSPRGRSLTLHPYRAALLARRAAAATDTYRHKLYLRAGIEGTISELVRRHGLRQARYRGLAKLQLQVYFTGAAVNLKRVIQWWLQPPLVGAATSG